jgi:hypothetical protein
MEEVRVLLLDLNAESGLSETLKPHVHPEKKPLAISESSILRDELSKSVLQFNPNPVFRVLTYNYLKQSIALIESKIR